MFKFYKKVEKSDYNMFGLEIIEDINPFEQPTFLSLLALNTRPRDTNGAINRILELSGIRMPNGEDNIQASDVDVNFLGLSYSEEVNDRYSKIASSDNNVNIDNDTRDFVLKYMLPLISINGRRKDFDECLRGMRNINIMCYCDALYMVKSISMILEDEMKKLNFSPEEIDNILSQVCIFPIGTEYPSIQALIPNIKFTSVFILDIQDSFGITDENTIQELFEGYRESLFITSSALDMPDDIMNKNSRILLVHDDGNHDLKSFIHKGIAFPSIIIKLVNSALNNSIVNNSNISDFIPIYEVINELENSCESLIGKSNEIGKDEMLADVLQNIIYQSTNAENKNDILKH